MHRLDLLDEHYGPMCATSLQLWCPVDPLRFAQLAAPAFSPIPPSKAPSPLQDVVIQCRCMLPDISTQHTLFVGESAFSLSSSESQRIFTRSKWLFLIIYFSSCLKVIVCACEKESSLSMQSIAKPTLYCQQMFSTLNLTQSRCFNL